MRSSEEKITATQIEMIKELDEIKKAVSDNDSYAIARRLKLVRELNDRLDEEICNYEDEIEGEIDRTF